MLKGIILALLANSAAFDVSALADASGEASISLSSSVRKCSAWFETRTSDSTPAVFVTSEGGLCFDGVIDSTGSSALRTALQATPADTSLLLVVRSGGGGISESLDVSDELADHDVTVAVHTLCASGCANNIFLPARKRVILNDAIVAFHGGATLSLAEKLDDERERVLAAHPGMDFERLSREWREKVERDVRRQDEMLRTAGIDRDFFNWFERMSKQPASSQSADCAANNEAEAIVFSEDFLRQRGVVIAYNGGPRSAADLHRINANRGWGQESCFWA